MLYLISDFSGYTLYGLSYTGVLGEFRVNNSPHSLGPTHCLIFSSLISAVDPVAVLAIFEEIHVRITPHNDIDFLE